MSKRTMGGMVAVVLVMVAGWALAQPGPVAGKKADAESSRFSVSPMGGSAVMVDTATGKAWVLQPSADGTPGVWLPTGRIDDPAVAEKWLMHQEKVKQEIARRNADLERDRQRERVK